jgi:holo-[acyl-carrier protein] synthase
MILGIGVDIVDVADFERRLQGGSLLKAFSGRDRAYADQRPVRRAEILAARWAAKEALAKALGTGLRAEWPLVEIEVTHDSEGRPLLELGPTFQTLIPPGSRVHCTLSHSPAMAVAFVVIEHP